MSTSERPTSAQDHESGAHGYRVNLPFVTAEFRAPHMPRLSAPSMPRVSMPHVSMPNRRALGEGIGAARNRLPSSARAAYYGGLAIMAALQLIEWPVAVALGVGTALAGRATSSVPRDKPTADEKPTSDEEPTSGEKAASGRKEATGKGAPATTLAQRAKRGTSAGRAATS